MASSTVLHRAWGAQVNDKVNIEAYQVGQFVNAVGARYKAERTTPPPRYDMATILDAMLSADRLAKTEADRKILRQVEGIGTSRTRQNIVDGLIQKGLLFTTRKGKRHELMPNEIARQMRSRLPPILCDVTMTAKWELGFSMIERGEVQWSQIVDKIYHFVDQIVEQAKGQKSEFKLAGTSAQHPQKR